MKNKYYKPEILSQYNKYSEEFFCKHLDKKDIESLGWKHEELNWDKVSEERTYKLDKYTILFFGYGITNEHLKGRLTIYCNIGTNEIIFDGIIKNKSELNKLMKMLNI